MEDYNVLINKGEFDCYVMPIGERKFNLCLSSNSIFRGNGLRCDLDFQLRSFGAQFKSAQKKMQHLLSLLVVMKLKIKQLHLKIFKQRNNLQSVSMN